MTKADRAAKIAAAAPKRRGPGPAVIVALLVVAALIVVGVWQVSSGSQDSQSTVNSAGVPKGGDANGGLNAFPGVKLADGAPKVEVFTDFQCPFCGHLAKFNGEAMNKLAKEGKIQLVEHHMKFLDENMRRGEKGPSHAAANAAYCAADEGVYPQVAHGIFVNQPEVEGQGFPDDLFTKLAQGAGVKGEALDRFEKCVSKKKYVDYVKKSDEMSARMQVTGTPAVRINGKDVAKEDMSQLVSAANTFETVLAKY
ncbi:DsbA family protein [Dermatophilus congolensis]|uniref:DsbA family protein n=1 Tax=Dermatophilus congolensis TaxID=1863 RepID=UPI001AAF710C|nr:thioredoxin domain-containing protein [Dermatophilus congolensis]MBO3143637.1 DsbA family protein [Dermatophilus congolensis]MBO3152629.1 DsbA family protein [Dermatophilus congolensis]MBO3160359.1 DsbA family protein [Dermatophilus congolensis]MBO3163914.1 DsbA family protein [Dermatophilus congolensis]MBO3177460.1 DsbA family protein [Dermatophilus congolensis]